MDKQLLLMAQAQAKLTSIEIERLQLIEAEGKWYSKDWGEGSSSTKVYREGGRFASPGASTSQLDPITKSDSSSESTSERLAKSLNLKGENTSEKVAQVQKAFEAFDIDAEALIKECDRSSEGALDSESRKKAFVDLNKRRNEQQKISNKAGMDALWASLEIAKKGGEAPDLTEKLSEHMIATAKAGQEIERCDALIDQVKGEGFSLTKRVSELAEIVEAEGADSPRAKWRAGVIKASIKYGSNIDAVANTELGSDEQKEAYENLLKTATKEKPSKMKVGGVSRKDDQTLAAMGPALGGYSYMLSAEKAKLLKESSEELAVFSKIVSTELNIKLGVVANRPFSIGGGTTKSGQLMDKQNNGQVSQAFDFFNTSDGLINMGDATITKLGGVNVGGYEPLSNQREHIREVAFHEAGHVLELVNDCVDASAALREDRAAETPPNKQTKMPPGMSQIGGGTDAALDRFLSPYQGLRMKSPDKSQDVNTEVVSSGFESLGSARLAGRMAAKDRETMLYALSVADTKPKKS